MDHYRWPEPWLLARRALTPNSKGELEVAYYLRCAPNGTSDDELIRVAGTTKRRSTE
ncbi:hypothetical protein ACLMAL_13615 [Nocardia sp. CWNU-33]|uniref:hypothetical protein n=1 Tax=Nocardia sp. CWNU-33 TaxID=3392117 RepID=UPI00398E5EC8